MEIVEQELWHTGEGSLGLGCSRCPDFNVCGGLSIGRSYFDCTDLCQSRDCQFCTQVVCRRNPRHFVARVHEVGGFLLDLPRVAALPSPQLGPYAPLLRDASRRRRPLETKVVAIPLRQLFSKRTGRLLVDSPEGLAERYCLHPSVQIVLLGVAVDQPLEDYWSKARAAGLPHGLVALKPALVTTPNFSLFPDVPRWDNLHNMKRIAIVWREMAEAGLPSSLHVNARTDHDWRRWGDFIHHHTEISSVTFEFGTGGRSHVRATWFAERLCELANRVGRPLQLITKGGRPFLRRFAASFHDVVFVDSCPYTKTNGRSLYVRAPGGRYWWQPVRMGEGELLDGLLDCNVRGRAQALRLLRSEFAHEQTA